MPPTINDAAPAPTGACVPTCTTPDTTPVVEPNAAPPIPLGVSADAWQAIGAKHEGGVWLIPEKNEQGEVIGWAIRRADGSKSFRPGGHRGLTMAWPLHAYAGTRADDPVLIVEGATDTAAGMSIDLDVVGRPSCTGGVKLLAAVLKDRHTCIIAENDQKPGKDGKPGHWPGREGANKVAKALLGCCASVNVVFPPAAYKDLRAWIIAGAGRGDIEAAISAAETFRIEAGTPREQSDEPRRRAKCSTLLVDLLTDAELFHTAEPNAYARVRVGDHSEVHRVRSRGFKLWLRGAYYHAHRGAPNAEAMEEALGTIEAKALFHSPERLVHLRLAMHEGAFYLADVRWRAVRIDRDGWVVVENPSVMFRRTKGMLLIPAPIRGGSVSMLRTLINVGPDETWVLVVAWLLAALRPHGPYPVLPLYGEQGSAKSTTARMLRRLIDPNAADVRAAPKDERDLAIAANNGWVFALDNLSGVHTWLSDALCRLSTGGGLATRTLYENDEETLFDYQRPAILTGIEDLATRPDLLDRSLPIVVPVIDESRRRPEDELWAEYERLRPAILGALLDAVSRAMGRLDAVKLDRLPRMADFAKWMIAAEPGLGWSDGTFLAAYNGNRAGANVTALESSPIIAPLVALAEQGDWSGSPTKLLAELARFAGLSSDSTFPDGWPKRANVLSGALRRLAPNLRATGIDVATAPGRSKGRVVSIRKIGATTVPIVPTVPDRVPLIESGGGAGRSCDPQDGGRVEDRPDGDACQLRDSAAEDGQDDGDGLLSDLSAEAGVAR